MGKVGFTFDEYYEIMTMTMMTTISLVMMMIMGIIMTITRMMETVIIIVL